MDYVVGCDVGSQGVKAVLLSVEGKLVGEASAGYAIEYPHPTWAEQPAEVWLTAIAQAVGALRATTGVAPDHIRAIGLDAQVDGVVAVDAAGKPLRPAIIWMDRRAVPQCDAVANAAAPIHLFQLSGLNLDPSHVPPKSAGSPKTSLTISSRPRISSCPAVTKTTINSTARLTSPCSRSSHRLRASLPHE